MLVGCVDAPHEIDETTQHAEVANGVSLNGVSLNGVSLNGVSLNGVSLNGVSLNGVSLNGVSLNGVSLNGVSLNGVSLNGVSLNGTRTDNSEHITLSSVGPQLVAALSNGTTLQLRIDAATQLTGENSDVWSYAVSYETADGWQPLCSAGALAVDGTWNTERGVPTGGAYTASGENFTFACRNRTIAKCVELGYKTWNGRTTELATCVRLLRGDFCGDGTPYTVDGTTLNLYDNVGIQFDTNSWMVEAEWSPAGALCITKPRYTRFEQLGFKPTCALEKLKDLCGNFNSGAVLIDELP
ncbi:MAG: ADYC domain-containing protein [Myxococcota bacterium]|nr:ADYC domain-containing protein [Myxococcota bacterium]